MGLKLYIVTIIILKKLECVVCHCQCSSAVTPEVGPEIYPVLGKKLASMHVACQFSSAEPMKFILWWVRSKHPRVVRFLPIPPTESETHLQQSPSCRRRWKRGGGFLVLQTEQHLFQGLHAAWLLAAAQGWRLWSGLKVNSHRGPFRLGNISRLSLGARSVVITSVKWSNCIYT